MVGSDSVFVLMTEVSVLIEVSIGLVQKFMKWVFSSIGRKII